jgi:hypothetical protein
METPRQKHHRYRYYKLIHTGMKALGWEEDGSSYRECLRRNGAKQVKGRLSKTTMSIPGLSAIVEDMKKCGFTPRSKVSTFSEWRKPRIKKITALWCALADAGVVHNRGEVAMAKWCATVSGISRLNWATSADLNNCIEALKSWAARERVKIQS